MNRFHVTEPALADLNEIWDYVALGSANAAERFIRKLLDKMPKAR